MLLKEETPLEHGSEVGIPTDGAMLPYWIIQSVQLPEAGSELLRLWETYAVVIYSLLDKAKRSKPISRSLSGSSEPIIFDHITQFGKICTPMGALVIRLATQAEQYATLEIPSELIATWLILTLHGKKGLPFHQNSQPIQTSEASYEKRSDGTVRMTFKPPAEQAPRLSFSYSSIITDVSTSQEDIPISAFQTDGYPIYPTKLNGHFLWDISEAHMCNSGCPCLDDYNSDDDYLVRRRRKKKKKPVFANTLCHTYSPHMPDEPDFQPLGKQTDPSTKVSSQPYIQSLVTPAGQLEEPRPFEAVLNWQTQNATSQNVVLQNLDHRVQSVATQVQNTDKNIDSIAAQLEQMYTDLKNRVTQLNSELRQMIQQRYWGPKFGQNEAEICKLQAELSRIDSEKQQPSLFAPTQPLPRHTSLNTSKSVTKSDSASDSKAEFADITKLLMAIPFIGSNDPSP
ncbi:hypothetical protein KPL70_003623 [Citrus sinensis]|nr:hypothetical protein KPL70_003623 [Citrus sinensis]